MIYYSLSTCMLGGIKNFLIISNSSDIKQFKTLLGNAEKAKKVVAEVLMSFEEDIDPKDPANNCLDVAVITDKKYWTKETIKNLSNIAGRVLNK